MKNNKKHVIIIEDDRSTHLLYSHIFKQELEDIQLEIVSSVEEAIPLLKSRQYDLYVVDMILAGGIDGSVLINTDYRPMMIVSAIPIQQKPSSVEYMQKPIDVDMFVEKVKQIVL